MKIHLDISGINLDLEVNGYTPHPQQEDEFCCYWCQLNYSFRSENWLSYAGQNVEVMTSYEVDSLAKDIRRLLSDQLAEPITKQLIEPDFRFVLHPKRDIRNDPGVIYVREGMEIADVFMEWRVYFWSGGLTDNYLTLTLYRQELECLLAYLELVTGAASPSSPEVSALVSQEIIIL